MEKSRLEQIERYIINFLRERGHTRILARELFESTAAYANADMVRALEDLEKHERLLVRHTTEGYDYVSLTAQGAAGLGLEQTDFHDESAPLPHPPNSATKST